MHEIVQNDTIIGHRGSTSTSTSTSTASDPLKSFPCKQG
jgi:hypothetical protein